MSDKILNFIFVLIVGNPMNSNVEFNNIWDFEPGVKLFTDLFQKEMQSRKKNSNILMKLK